jgi:hypothetical protein
MMTSLPVGLDSAFRSLHSRKVDSSEACIARRERKPEIGPVVGEFARLASATPEITLRSGRSQPLLPRS